MQLDLLLLMVHQQENWSWRSWMDPGDSFLHIPLYARIIFPWTYGFRPRISYCQRKSFAWHLIFWYLSLLNYTVLQLNPQFFFPSLRHRNCKQRDVKDCNDTIFLLSVFPAASAKRSRELPHILATPSRGSETCNTSAMRWLPW